ncbi:MAG: Smr/MutS family protein [Cytophagales bacterium]
MKSVFQVGDKVSLIGSDSVGEIISLRGENVEVILNGLVVKSKTSKLIHSMLPETDDRIESSKSEGFFDTKEKLMSFKFELDVKGMMKDEALLLINQQMDDAILLGVNSFIISHGRSGQLKSFVRSELKKYSQIKSLEDAPLEKGGENATVVNL